MLWRTSTATSYQSAGLENFFEFQQGEYGVGSIILKYVPYDVADRLYPFLLSAVLSILQSQKILRKKCSKNVIVLEKSKNDCEKTFCIQLRNLFHKLPCPSAQKILQALLLHWSIPHHKPSKTMKYEEAVPDWQLPTVLPLVLRNAIQLQSLS